MSSFWLNRKNIKLSRIYHIYRPAQCLKSTCLFPPALLSNIQKKFSFSYKSIWNSRVGTKLLWAIQNFFWLYQGFLKLEILGQTKLFLAWSMIFEAPLTCHVSQATSLVIKRLAYCCVYNCTIEYKPLSSRIFTTS